MSRWRPSYRSKFDSPIQTGAVHAGVIHTSHTVVGIPPGSVGDPFNPVHAPGGPSASDLINGLLPIASGPGGFQLEGSEELSSLTDGSISTFVGAGSGADLHTGYATTGGGSGGQSATYDLGGKYNLTKIVSFGGWADTGPISSPTQFGFRQMA